MAASEGESLTVFTVPGELGRASTPVVWSEHALTVVGLVTVDGRELWLPNNTSEYKHIGGYKPGYNRDNAEPTQLNLGAMAHKFTQFVEEFLLDRGWVRGINMDEGEEIAYNCDGFSFWLTGQQTDWDLHAAKEMAARGVGRGEALHERLVAMGGVAVIGARLPGRQILAIHTYVSLGGGLAIQVTGGQGRIIVASEQEIRGHYMHPWYQSMYMLEEGELQVYQVPDTKEASLR